MCGIAGLLSKSPDRLVNVGRMGDPLAHRGPDDSGCWLDVEAGVAFAHRRLAIVDLSPQGHQPMVSADGRYVLTYNGEIYNHLELRAELAPAGGWRGHSDTETLIEAIARWGLEQAIDRCTGMFAFALWDRKERKLFLVRDRFGEKPLYYGWVGGDFLFGSELKAFAAHPAFAPTINSAAVAALIARSYIPTPLSIYRRIFKLQPASVLEVDGCAAAHPRDDAPTADDRSPGLILSHYWSYSDVLRSGANEQLKDETEALDALEASLCKAIRSQSMADVPVGAFLSGGLDSSLITALYQKHSRVPVRTFTIGFHEQGYNEAEAAKAVARHLGTVHDECYVTAKEAADVIPMLPDIYDEPFADSSQIPTYLVSRFARNQVTVALTGDGGDEFFGGYTRHRVAVSLWNRLERVPKPLRGALTSLLGLIPPALWNVVTVAAGDPVGQRGAKVARLLRAARHARGFEDIFASTVHQWPYERSPVGLDANPAAGFDFGDVGHPDAVRAMYCDTLAYLPDDILCKVDRASMAVSLETRVPFLDHGVAALAARIPLSMKIGASGGKLVTRKLLGRELPPSLYDRPKAGFALPVGEWLKGPLRSWAEALLDPAKMNQQGWFDVAFVQRVWREHLNGRRNATESLWTVLMFQAWLQRQVRA